MRIHTEHLHFPQCVRTAWLSGVESIWTPLFINHTESWVGSEDLSENSAQIKLWFHTCQSSSEASEPERADMRLASWSSPVPEAGHHCPLPRRHTESFVKPALLYDGQKIWKLKIPASSVCANSVDSCKYLLNLLCSQGISHFFPLPSGTKFITQSNRWMSSYYHINLLYYLYTELRRQQEQTVVTGMFHTEENNKTRNKRKTANKTYTEIYSLLEYVTQDTAIQSLSSITFPKGQKQFYFFNI